MATLADGFLNYIFDTFYNQIFDAVKEFIDDNVETIRWKTSDVDPDTANLDSLFKQRIILQEAEESNLVFDVIVEGEIELQEVCSHRYDSEGTSEWFRVSCTGNLDCWLNDFQVNSVSVYDHTDNPVNRLNDNLVPYLRGGNLDEYAIKVLKQYYPEALNEPVMINPELLAERMGLKVESCRLSLDGTISGAIFFADCDTEVYENSISPQKKHIAARTVVYDPSCLSQKVPFTIVHECMHWVLHRQRFLLQRLYNKDACQIRCSVEKKIVNGDKEKSETEWLEWQANSLASHVLMPFKQFRQQAKRTMDLYISICAPDYSVDIMEDSIVEVADFFGVSKLAATIRMVEIGVEETLGVFNYVDGHYVKPHAFKRGTLKKNQTFSISYLDFAVESFSHPDLKQALQDGQLVFVDSHICINSPKYVSYSRSGQVSMTEYGRTHMDECCMIFDVSVRNASDHQKIIYDCALYRCNDSLIFEAHVAKGKGLTPEKNLIDATKEFNEEMRKVIAGMPRDFGQCIKYLCKWREMTQEQLAEATGTSTNTIRNISSPNSPLPTVEILVAICVGLHLPPVLCQELMSTARVELKLANPDHMAYDTILRSCVSMNIQDVNEFLIQQGRKPLNGT